LSPQILAKGEKAGTSCPRPVIRAFLNPPWEARAGEVCRSCVGKTGSFLIVLVLVVLVVLENRGKSRTRTRMRTRRIWFGL